MSRLLSHVKMGPSTNSSSCHSIIRCDQRQRDRRDPEGQYGWDEFVLSSSDAKKRYFRTALVQHHLTRGLLPPEAEVLVDEFFASRDVGQPDDYIDHQSQLCFPQPRFLEDLTFLYTWIQERVIQDPNISIFGGNDNMERRRSLPGSLYEGPWIRDPYPEDRDGFFFKVDPGESDPFISCFSKQRRLTIRTKTLSGADPVRATRYPDLVDLKITNRCNSGCSFCYQNSHSEGQHADFGWFRGLIWTLADMGVFEVAIGGGEPTLFPMFGQLLSQFSRNGITPSFSTRSLSWLDDDDLVSEVREVCGGVAFSTCDLNEALCWLELAEEAQIPHPTIHYVLGIRPVTEIRGFLEGIASRDSYEEVTVVFLKWKPTGRASSRPPHQFNSWWRYIRPYLNSRLINISVDSFLIPDIRERLPEVSSHLYHEDDGRFSFYIDGVERTMSPHSASDIRLPICESSQDPMVCLIPRLWTQIQTGSLNSQSLEEQFFHGS